MIPQDLLDMASRVLLERNVKVLQGFRLGPTDATHVAALLDHMAPRRDTLWADIGCGFGEVARLMSQQRPDLNFVLINNNQLQLEHAPRRFLQLCDDMEYTRLPDASVDGCMFLYSLCHAESVHSVLEEAARVTRPSGELFVFDYERMAGDDDLMWQYLFARADLFEDTRDIAKDAGWDVVLRINPTGTDALFRELFGDEALYDLIFNDLRPVIWKAVRT